MKGSFLDYSNPGRMSMGPLKNLEWSCTSLPYMFCDEMTLIMWCNELHPPMLPNYMLITDSAVINL